MRRGYQQYCALARALDHVGDRWTLLVVRELLLGPRRYSDIRQALPGIATNLLADRLRGLETGGLVRRRELPPPAAAVVYELTEHGQGLEEAVMALIRWGGQFMGSRKPGETFRAEWLVLALRAVLPAPAPTGVTGTCEFRTDGMTVTVTVRSGRTEVVAGGAARPDAVLTCAPEHALGVASGRYPLEQALRDQHVTATGNSQTVIAFAHLFRAARDASGVA
ncbi:winged helix-turn-helix transcriptional regulator [Streptomyces sp. NPDC019443]|uniref:winged helix-turn-helix transcriptional regulator n=1 Tax=Streptomyces sp. NPDC019443 TaxID=3365061 RepID=UPI0037A275D5